MQQSRPRLYEWNRVEALSCPVYSHDKSMILCLVSNYSQDIAKVSDSVMLFILLGADTWTFQTNLFIHLTTMCHRAQLLRLHPIPISLLCWQNMSSRSRRRILAAELNEQWRRNLEEYKVENGTFPPERESERQKSDRLFCCGIWQVPSHFTGILTAKNMYVGTWFLKPLKDWCWRCSQMSLPPKCWPIWRRKWISIKNDLWAIFGLLPIAINACWPSKKMG